MASLNGAAPDERYAVIYIPATDAPSHWANYRIPDYAMFGYTADRASSDPASPALAMRAHTGTRT